MAQEEQELDELRENIEYLERELGDRAIRDAFEDIDEKKLEMLEAIQNEDKRLEDLSKEELKALSSLITPVLSTAAPFKCYSYKLKIQKIEKDLRDLRRNRYKLRRRLRRLRVEFRNLCRERRLSY